MSLETKKFGTTRDGEEVTLYSLTNTNGMKAEFINYGANIVSLYVPGKDGKLDDVVLGFDDVAGYEVNGCFFGSFIGRHGNRIGGAQFELNGVTYELEKNDGENNLHGGTPGYHHVMYEAEASEDSVTFSRISPDMEQGYPGNLDIRVTYTLTEDNELKIQYDAKSDKDTLCNVTNHSYFNLKGHDGGVVTGHKVWIKANGFTETSDDLIPNGTIVDVTGTPMDFRTKRRSEMKLRRTTSRSKSQAGMTTTSPLIRRRGSWKRLQSFPRIRPGARWRYIQIFRACSSIPAILSKKKWEKMAQCTQRDVECALRRSFSPTPSMCLRLIRAC